jgi:diacylglycerol O-acyltransferase / wax synthase
MDRMSAMDAMFYYMEDENTPMHVGGVSVLEGPAPAYGDIVRLLASKLDRVPRYRQVVKPVPLHLGRPIWVDDPHFQILYHVRHTALPKPGGDEQLRNLAGRVFAQRLDMSKPVWETWLVEGLAGDRWALISKAHHAMIDGEGSTDLMQVIFDLEENPERPEPADWHPQPFPSTLTVTAGSIRDAVQEPLQLLRVPSRESLNKVPLLLAGARVAAKELLPSVLPTLLPGRGQPTPASMNGPLGPNRRWVWANATMSEVKRIRAGLGGTVNDVILTAITRGYRDLLEGRGELVPDMVVRSLVPVSTRGEAGRGQVNNQVTSVVVDLPVGTDDPARRLELIRAQMDRNKRGMGAVDAAAIVGLADFAAPTLLALGARSMSIVPNRLTQTGTTNVPGPRVPLYLLGRKLIESHPYVPVFAGVRVAVGVFSYLDRFSFGVTADFDSFPDVDVVGTGIRIGFDELTAQAGAVAKVAAVTLAAKPRKRAPRAPRPRAPSA